MKIRTVVLISVVITLARGGWAQPEGSNPSNEIWSAIENFPRARMTDPNWIDPTVYEVFALDQTALMQALDAAPRQLTPDPASTPGEITLPTPQGRLARFRFVESPVMEPGLAAKFPDLKTYLGQGIDDPTAAVRFDWTDVGFRAQVLSPGGAYFIDPLAKGDRILYACYYKRDDRSASASWTCLTRGAGSAAPAVAPGRDLLRGPGVTLRSYRLALAANVEYSAKFGATTESVMAELVTLVNRMNGIYELELAIHLNLVADNDQIIFLTEPDPYTNNDASQMILANQTELDSTIGSANYDVGHVVSTGGGGLAGLGVVCNAVRKARGVTGSSNPTGENFWVDFVAHELGHQFGGSHSFNGKIENCAGGNRNGSTAYEPGSGSTIQAYAGICGTDNLQPHSDPYFHSISLDEMNAYITSGTGSNCFSGAASGNTAPTTNAGPDYTIPANTPFTLTASGSDPDGDALTYCWEERDLGPAQEVSELDNGQSPIFRSLTPTSDPSRVFPRLPDLLNNTSTIGEQLPTTSRTLNFRVTVRDNRAGAGATAFDQMQLTVANTAGPFVVTFPTTAVSLNSSATVTWNVANTNAAPVNAAQVDILLSTDGGNTFPFTLALSTPNDGSETVTFPGGIMTSQARVKIQGSQNIFFDISDVNFNLSTPVGVAFGAAPGSTLDDTLGNGNGNSAADPGETEIHLKLMVANQGSLGATGVLATLTSPDSTVTIVRGRSAYPDLAGTVPREDPSARGPGGSGTNIDDFVVALDPSHPTGSNANLSLHLESDQGSGDIDFQLASGSSQKSFPYDGPSTPIPDGTGIPAQFTINVSGVGVVSDIDFSFDGAACTVDPLSTTVGLAHSWVGDLTITLISPMGTEVKLADRPGGGSFGSSGNNFCATVFDDAAGGSIQDISSGDQPHTGSWSPAEPLSAFKGENADGVWTLRVQDNAPEDSGVVHAFSLIFSGSAQAAYASSLEYASEFFGAAANGWTGGAPFAGIPGVWGADLAGQTGLCVTSDLASDNAAIWASPERIIDLKDNAIYRVIISLTTDQTLPGAIAFWSLVYDNFTSASGFLNFGGERFFIDVPGGAAGIGRPMGRDEWEIWITPIGVSTPQWRAAAFDPANANLVDIRLLFRVIDLNAAIGASEDSGTICLRDIRVDSLDLDSLTSELVWGPAIDPSTHELQTPFSSSPVNVTNGYAQFTMAAPAPGGADGIVFRPNKSAVTESTVQDLPNPLKFHPVAWTGDTLYCLEIDMRSELSDLDPPDYFSLVFDVPTFEQGAADFATRGIPGGLMDRAASPRTTVSTYRSYWYSHNVTLFDPSASIPGIASVRGYLQGFNLGSLYDRPTGSDTIRIEGIRVSKITGFASP